MNSLNLKIILLAGVFSLMPVVIHAAESEVQAAPETKAVETETKPAETFQSVCLGSWMKRQNDIQDKVDYKNFGEKYCECASGQPLDNDDAIDKAIQLCMSRTLLHDTMDALDDKIGLDKATESDIDEHCQSRWQLVYPQLSDKGKEAATAYCKCSQPKLMSLIKKSDNMTDKAYYDEIDSIAASCSQEIKPDDESDKASKTTTN